MKRISKPGRPGASRTELLVTGILGVAAVIALLANSSDGPQTIYTRNGEQISTDLPSSEILADWYRRSHRMGPADAPIQIIEFGNFTCEYCRALYASLDTLHYRYSGIISIQWLHAVEPVRREGNSTRNIAVAAECAAAQGEFEAFYHAAFRSVATMGTRSGVLAVADSADIPDRVRFLACFDAGEMEEVVDRHVAAAEAINVSVTPTWFLNGRLILGTLPTAVIDSLILVALRQ